MVHRNPNMKEFKLSYLFVEMATRRKAFQLKNPNAKIISLGIGDTTEPITSEIGKEFHKKVDELQTVEGYTGYPDFNGSAELRKRIVEVFYKNTNIQDDDVFVSDGSKPDLARLQLLFPTDTTIAVQDPVYPAYVDGAVISGKAGVYDENKKGYSKIVYMPCTPENNFFPNLKEVPRTDLIFFCSPNNPTGATATRENLVELVEFAKKNKSIIIYDAAYSAFISDLKYPKTIYEIEGAHEVAFETNSFSKSAGFTGIRLGWTVCPQTLKYACGTSVQTDWARIMGTCFNGACSISERGALKALSPNGLAEIKYLVNYYMTNAKHILKNLRDAGLKCYGGTQGPYIWVQMENKNSWEMFEYFLENAHVIVTPGVGFGTKGSNFVRISSFAHQEDVQKAVQRLVEALKKMN